MPAKKPFTSRAHIKKRWRLWGGSLLLLFLAGVTLVAVLQLPVVRDFLSRASGEPANLVVDTQAILGPLPRPWRHLAQGGESHDWRMGGLIGPVRQLQPRYVRLDHIYTFYDVVQGSPGNITFDWTKLDAVVDDIRATGATPYLALSYMPTAISRGDILDQPVNWSDWQLVVQRTIEHYSGDKNIPNVHYEVWNEPDLFGGWKYYGDKNYLTLYTYASRGATSARVRQPFKLGGPATTALYKNWFDAMAAHVIANNLRWDFFSWHRYNNSLEVFREDMLNLRQWITAYPQLEPTLEFHLTEWGHDSDNHAGYDTNYGAAHTVAAAMEMVGVIDQAFVFEIQDGKDPAGQARWGRWGLFTHGDFGAQAKPRYYGLRLLDSLGQQRLQLLGKGTWVKALAARDLADTVSVVLANFDPRGRNTENVPIRFDNITPGSYTITRTYLDGRSQREKVATDAAVLQTYINMPVNTVAKVELSPSQQ